MLAIFHLNHFPIYYLVIITQSLFAVSSLFSIKTDEITVTRNVTAKMLLCGSQEPSFVSHNFEPDQDSGAIFCLQCSHLMSGGQFKDSRALWGGGSAPLRCASALIEVNSNNMAEGRKVNSEGSRRALAQICYVPSALHPKTTKAFLKG